MRETQRLRALCLELLHSEAYEADQEWWEARIDGNDALADSIKQQRDREHRKAVAETQATCHHRPAWYSRERRYYCTRCGLRSDATGTFTGPFIDRGGGFQGGDRWVHEQPVRHVTAFQRPARPNEGNQGEYLIVSGCGYTGWVKPSALGGWDLKACEYCAEDLKPVVIGTQS